MLLRSVNKHVNDQNWVAITNYFYIVVVCVFIGIQVANWNDERKEFAVEELYLERLSNDLQSSISGFQATLDFASESGATVQTFIKQLHSPTISDEDLVQAAEDYFTDGVFLAGFDPTTTTFDDLRSTGNLRVLRNAELRDALVELHAEFDNVEDSFRNNLEWVTPFDSRAASEFDWLRFDSRTSQLFPEQAVEQTAIQIRAYSDQLTRHAAFHYWLKDRAIELIRNAIDISQDTLNRIEAERREAT